MEPKNEIADLAGFADKGLKTIKNAQGFEIALKKIPHCRIRNFRKAVERINGDIFIESRQVFIGKIEYWRAISYKEKGNEIRIFVPFLKKNDFKEPVKIYTKGKVSDVNIEILLESIIGELKKIRKSN